MSKLTKTHIGEGCYQYTQESINKINKVIKKHGGKITAGEAINIIESHKIIALPKRPRPTSTKIHKPARQTFPVSMRAAHAMNQFESMH